MFAHPELFCSAAPGGSGLGAERAQAKNDGVETSSFEPPLARMSSQNGATTITFDEPAPRPGSDALNGETDRAVRINRSNTKIASCLTHYSELSSECFGRFIGGDALGMRR